MPPEKREKAHRGFEDSAPATPTDSLEARLRRLPVLPVSADLEARLLATIPARVAGASPSGVASAPRALPALTQPGPPGRWRWGWWVGAASALAAACVLIVLFWPKRDDQKPDSKDDRLVAQDPIKPVEAQSSQQNSDRWSQARGPSDEPKLPAFTWPVEDSTHVMLSSSIPSDLLD